MTISHRAFFLLVLLSTHNTVFGFLDDILRQFAQQGGGGHQQHHQRRVEGFPRNVPDDVSELDEKWLWLRGTTWNWNNWRDVTFEPDGTFNAPTPECQNKGCQWSAGGKKGRVYVVFENFNNVSTMSFKTDKNITRINQRSNTGTYFGARADFTC